MESKLIPYKLLITQGVSGAIKKQTGNGPFDALRKDGPMHLGEARLTEAPNLPFKGIIHVAGINHLWKSSEASVRDSVRNALNLASEKGFQSIAFPAIGAGSSIKLPKGREIPVWGVTTSESLRIIEEEVKKSAFEGKVIIVQYAKAT